MDNIFLECSEKLKEDRMNLENYIQSLENAYSNIDKFNKGEIQWILNNINLNCSLLNKSYQSWYDKFNEYLVIVSSPKRIITEQVSNKKSEEKEEKEAENKMIKIEGELKDEIKRLKTIITCQNQTVNKFIRINNENNRKNQEEFSNLIIQKENEIKELEKKFFELESDYQQRICKLSQEYQNQYEQFEKGQINIFRNVIRLQDSEIKKYRDIYSKMSEILKNTGL